MPPYTTQGYFGYGGILLYNQHNVQWWKDDIFGNFQAYFRSVEGVRLYEQTLSFIWLVKMELLEWWEDLKIDIESQKFASKENIEEINQLEEKRIKNPMLNA